MAVDVLSGGNRVACLYRVSTKKQVGIENDIPLQEISCRDFVASNGWVVTKEYYEKGISGYKKSAEKRDVLQAAKKDATAKKFDILLVFMFDRIGRREQETPFVVEWFVAHGVRVWSVKEGEQRFDSHVDKLTNYIRFWQASGESGKTSMRVKERQQQLVKSNIWRGGVQPFGYTLVHNGRVGKKNRLLYDIEIDDAQAKIIKEIFYLTCTLNWGRMRIANYLNDKYGDIKTWVPMSVATIQRNSFYTGRMKFNEMLSDPNEALRLISDSDFDLCQKTLVNRQTRKNLKRIDPDTGELLQSKIEKYGAVLLRGIVFCGGCGSRLTATYVAEKRNKTVRYRQIYRCYNSATKQKGCTGQSTYSAEAVDECVLTEVEKFIKSLGSYTPQVKSNENSKLINERKTLTTLTKKKDTLQQESIRAICGESQFSQENLNEMLTAVTQNIERCSLKIIELTQHISEREQVAGESVHKGKELISLYDGFKKLLPQERRVVIAKIVDKVIIYRENPNEHLNVTIKFNGSEQAILGN